MSLEGKLDIQLQTSGRRVEQVRIRSTRPVRAAGVLRGKPVAEVQKLLPLLFSICGTAQACASARACERALKTQPTLPVEALREQLVRLETIREHLWRIMLDWPVFLGEEAAEGGMSSLLGLERQYRQILTGGVDPFIDPGGLALPRDPRQQEECAEKIDQMLEQHVFGMAPRHWLRIESPGALEDWLDRYDTIASRFLTHVLDHDWAAIGRADTPPLPLLGERDWAALAAQENFAVEPQWQGQCHETTSFTRCSSPLLERYRAEYANGLMVRLLARLSEMARLAQSLRVSPAKHVPETVEPPADSVQNPGIGQVSAARGQLVHRVEVEGNTVVDYRIIAPTEWNFHPRGVVTRSLESLRGDREQIAQQARLLINAIDPCVAFELGVN